jgi:hypothetical protein
VTQGARIGSRGLGGQNTNKLIVARLLEVVWDVLLRYVIVWIRPERWVKALGGEREMSRCGLQRVYRMSYIQTMRAYGSLELP